MKFGSESRSATQHAYAQEIFAKQFGPKVAGDLSGRHSSMEDISEMSDASTTKIVRVRVVVECDRAQVRALTLLYRTHTPSSSTANVSTL